MAPAKAGAVFLFGLAFGVCARLRCFFQDCSSERPPPPVGVAASR
jgi:hypothetical protein